MVKMKCKISVVFYGWLFINNYKVSSDMILDVYHKQYFSFILIFLISLKKFPLGGLLIYHPQG